MSMCDNYLFNSIEKNSFKIKIKILWYLSQWNRLPSKAMLKNKNKYDWNIKLF